MVLDQARRLPRAGVDANLSLAPPISPCSAASPASCTTIPACERRLERVAKAALTRASTGVRRSSRPTNAACCGNGGAPHLHSADIPAGQVTAVTRSSASSGRSLYVPASLQQCDNTARRPSSLMTKHRNPGDRRRVNRRTAHPVVSRPPGGRNCRSVKPTSNYARPWPNANGVKKAYASLDEALNDKPGLSIPPSSAPLRTCSSPWPPG